MAVPVEHETPHAAEQLSAENCVSEVKEKDTNWRKLLEFLPWISQYQPLHFWKAAEPRAGSAGGVAGLFPEDQPRW